MHINKLMAGLGASFLLTLVLPLSATAATTTSIVTPTNNQGWIFNPDPENATPYEFNTNEASTGVGSLYVKPITNTLGTPGRLDKFIAKKVLATPVSNVSSISYDFLIAGNGTSASANQFYLNVYTNLPGSTTYYDCRFDYVPATGSTTAFTTASFSSTATPSSVVPRGSATCPTTLAGMVSGSTAKFIALNVGDTSTSDTGLAGYLDNVVITTTNNTNIYDFEPYVVASNKDDCKKDGYKLLTNQTGQAFKNQGACVSFIASAGRNQQTNQPQF